MLLSHIYTEFLKKGGKKEGNCGKINTYLIKGMSVYCIFFLSLSPPAPNLRQVVEIATYTDHVLTECEAKSNFGKCPRCSEAIPVVELDQHIADKTCNRKPQCHALFFFFLLKKYILFKILFFNGKQKSVKMQVGLKGCKYLHPQASFGWSVDVYTSEIPVLFQI